MNTTPALVTRDAARTLPRPALLILCAVYLLPGLFGRDPWRNADLTAYGVMLAMAEGRIAWTAPALGGVAIDTALPAHWLGAWSIRLLGGLGLYEPLAARIPFVLLLAATLALLWYATYQLARTEAAQPVAFAFGGEAQPRDYARALADGAVLAFMATLGLLQLGHETTPEILQLAAITLVLWALSVSGGRHRATGPGAALGLMLLAFSGAPDVALGAGLAAWLVCERSGDAMLKPLRLWLWAGLAAAVLITTWQQGWRWRFEWPQDGEDVAQILRLLAWFTWPTAPLAAITLWRWRRQGLRRHVAVPASLGLIAMAHAVAVGGSDRALLLALPGIAILAAFALPTLSRSTSAAVDWFSIFFFSGLALAVWVVYGALQTGWPEQPARNAAAVAPEYMAHFSAWPLLLGLAGTVAWCWVVRWRTGRHQKALWKSMVLPAGGVALNWLLALTLLLHPLDYTRSLSPWTQALAPHVGQPSCIAAPGMQIAYVAALEAHGQWRVDATADSARTSACDILILTEGRDGALPFPDGWVFKARVRRPTERQFAALIFTRSARAGAPAKPAS